MFTCLIRKRPWLAAAFVAVSCAALAAVDSSGQASISALAQANNEFGFKLARELTRAEPGRNICISPFSLASVLQIVRNGAAGETRKEMDKALEIIGLTTTNLATSYADLARSLKMQSTNCELEIANAIWFAPNIPLNPAFESLNKKFYDSQIASLDFTDPRTGGMVNSWVSQKTHGRIPEVFEGSLRGDTGALVLNTAYFRGKWAKAFDPRQTRERPFKPASGNEKPVRMMHISGQFSYSVERDFEAVCLPYAGGRVAMVLLLPARHVSPTELLEHLTATNWFTNPDLSGKEKSGDILIPLLKLDYRVELNAHLSRLGIQRAFGSSADFSGITSDALFIGRMLQKVCVEVTEEGTTAASASAALQTRATHFRDFEFVANRPFLFAIRDVETQAILFFGIIQDPA